MFFSLLVTCACALVDDRVKPLINLAYCVTNKFFFALFFLSDVLSVDSGIISGIQCTHSETCTEQPPPKSYALLYINWQDVQNLYALFSLKSQNGQTRLGTRGYG